MSCALPAAPPTRLAAFGRWMQRNRTLVLGLQWVTLFAYLFLVAVPAFLPLPDNQAHLWDDLTRFAQFVFWGIWWPFVLVSMMLMGRAWCGVLCPEGFVTEQVSRVGLGRPVPRWIKWGGWPFVAFLGTTVYGQLVSVYEYPKAVLLVLGGSTVAAIAFGLVYGRNKRVWCRHLCPVNGVFGLLSRLAPVHFRTDRDRWDHAEPARVIPVNCAPLVDIRRMESSAGCHMCGRCAGHRDAVELAGRAPGSEVAQLEIDDVNPWEVRLLVYGLIGTAIGAFQWSASPWFVQAKIAAAEWLIEHDSYALLGDNAPWWLLTHYPEASDVFTWLDGLMILGYIGAAALLIGGWISLWLRLTGYLTGRARAHLQLAYALIPIGGAGVFLGLSALTVSLLAAEGINIAHLPLIRGLLLGAASLASLALAGRMVSRMTLGAARAGLVLATFAIASAGAVLPWVVMYYVW
ncbi:4Fe-4S binding protein [Denitromonas ohlonensis]|uniref:4Fe-4S binding protein n=2 Tax=Denitromonas TaxID=139331 RepID=A0A557RUI1_9RHOO|nr:4Fe-4S binding protein [Denitromonas ohlonensis]TVO68796.1 4Fe-4S binding protein [Denitromonas ohlonensis]TVO72838.1 4Fe-4S binding protein [Denitromonas ohlonensis]